MKKTALGLLLLAMAGCGDGGGDQSTAANVPDPATDNTPRIYNLTYSPQSFPVGAEGGRATITGSINAVDPYGDMGVIELLDSTGAVMTGFNPNIPAGTTRATISASFTVSTAKAGVYPFTVVMLRKSGMTLGKQSGSIVIYAPQ